MGIQNFLIFLFLFFFLSLVHAQNSCPNSYCEKNGLAIQFPFWLQRYQPQKCQPIGFNLSCNSQEKPILNIPYSGDFIVSSIHTSYDRKVVLSDPENCLPRRLLSLNLSSSPFKTVSNENYTFFSCPKGQMGSYTMDCLSNTTTDIVVASKYQSDSMKFFRCNRTVTLFLPVSSSYSYEFPLSFELRWDMDISPTGPATDNPVPRIIAMSLVMSAGVIPALIVGISCCICMMRRENRQRSDLIPTSGETHLTENVTAGLDKSIIETYTKITVSESGRVGGPNDATCTICLAEYVQGETVRFMPECLHCFHVECIDEWLSMNAKCPICRTLQTCNTSS